MDLCLSRMTSSATLTTDTLASTWLQFSDTEYPLYYLDKDNIKIKGSAAEHFTGNHGECSQ